MSTEPAAPQPARRRSPWRALLWLVALLLVAAVLAIGALLAALRSERGSAWLLSHVPGLEVSAPRGALLGDFSAARVQWRGSDDALLVIDGLQWQNLSLRYLSDSQPHVSVSFDRLAARRVEFKPGTTPASSEPMQAPSDLSSPIELHILALSLGELRLSALGDKPLR